MIKRLIVALISGGLLMVVPINAAHANCIAGIPLAAEKPTILHQLGIVLNYATSVSCGNGSGYSPNPTWKDDSVSATISATEEAWPHQTDWTFHYTITWQYNEALSQVKHVATDSWANVTNWGIYYGWSWDANYTRNNYETGDQFEWKSYVEGKMDESCCPPTVGVTYNTVLPWFQFDLFSWGYQGSRGVK